MIHEAQPVSDEITINMFLMIVIPIWIIYRIVIWTKYKKNPINNDLAKKEVLISFFVCYLIIVISNTIFPFYTTPQDYSDAITKINMKPFTDFEYNISIHQKFL